LAEYIARRGGGNDGNRLESVAASVERAMKPQVWEPFSLFELPRIFAEEDDESF
jgi:hypothetical protein